MKRVIAFCAAVMLAAALNAAEYPDVTISELKADISAGKAIVIDANGTESWQKGHIPTAIDFEANHGKKLASLLPKDKNALVVAYCAGPKCKAYQAAAKEAEKLGYKNIKHLSAGISGWKDAGEKMEITAK